MSLADLDSEVVTADLLAPPDAGRQIAQRVNAIRRDVVRNRTATRWLLALAAGLALWAGWTYVDYIAELTWTVRAIGLATIVASVILVARRGLPRWTGAYRLEDAASDVERQLSQFGQRLRTTLDYQELDQSGRVRPARAEPELVRALEDDTFALSRAADFDVVIDSRPIVASVAIVAACVCFWLLAFVSSSEWRTATGRTLLLPWQYTQVDFAPAEATVKQGENVTIGVEIAGRPVKSAVVRYRAADSTEGWSELKLELDAEPADGQKLPLVGKLSATIADCQNDLEFQVAAGPVPLPLGKVRVLQPLTIESIRADVTPPEYLGRAPEQFERWTFKVAEGSQVDLAVELNRAAAEARLTPVTTKSGKSQRDGPKTALDADATEQPAAALSLLVDGPTLRGQLGDLRASGVWELTARTADGIDLEPQRLFVRVQMDGRAQVRFVEPNEELEVIATAEVPLTIEAVDDHTLLRVGIASQVSGGPMEVLWQQEFERGTTETVRGGTNLQLEDHQLTYQDGVTYYAFAEDNYFGQPRRTTTPLRFIDIRPFKMAFQMLDTGGT